MKNMLARAIEIAVLAHSGQFDKSGQPYILHPLWVMNKVRHLGSEAMIVGVLHDVVEDTKITIEMLIAEGFSERIIKALKLLDFRNVDYFDRIEEIIKDDDLAREIKMRDIRHNGDLSRIKSLRPKDFQRAQKYHIAYSMLKEKSTMFRQINVDYILGQK